MCALNCGEYFSYYIQCSTKMRHHNLLSGGSSSIFPNCHLVYPMKHERNFLFRDLNHYTVFKYMYVQYVQYIIQPVFGFLPLDELAPLSPTHRCSSLRNPVTAAECINNYSSSQERLADLVVNLYTCLIHCFCLFVTFHQENKSHKHKTIRSRIL